MNGNGGSPDRFVSSSVVGSPAAACSGATGLLLECLRAGTDGGARAERLSPEELRSLEGAALRHGLGPLLHHHLHRFLPPSDTAVLLRDLQVANSLRNTAVFESLSQVLTALREARIDVLVLKGAYLAEHVYPEPGLRPMLDLDLLVRPADLDGSRRVLGALGYRADRRATDEQRHHLPPLHKPGAIPIELHRTLTTPSHPVSLETERFWRDARAVTVAGVPALALSPDGLLLHLCVHASRNHAFRVPLLHLLDVALVLRRWAHRLDWPGIVDDARRWGIGPQLRAVLLVVEKGFGEAPPEGALDELRDDGGAEEMARLFWEELSDPPLEIPWLYHRWVQARGIRAKIRTLAEALAPPAEVLRRLTGLPPASRKIYPHYLIRPAGFLLRRGGFALDLLLNSPRVRPARAVERRRRQLRWWAEER